MAELSNWAENAFGNHFLRGASSPTTSAYMALGHTVTDAEAGTWTELTNGTAPGYARKAADLGAPSNGVFTNTADILFADATADWPQATHYVFMDALNGGNPISIVKALPTPRTVLSGDRARFPAGQLSFTLA